MHGEERKNINHDNYINKDISKRVHTKKAYKGSHHLLPHSFIQQE